MKEFFCCMLLSMILFVFPVNSFAGPQEVQTDYNIFYGIDAGINTAAWYNAFYGPNAGKTNTSGTNNSFFGYASGVVNSSGNNNSFFGSSSGRLSKGSNNSFFGAFAGELNDSGAANCFFGKSAGGINKTGTNNCFFGYNAGSTNEGGDFNCFFGSSTGENTTGNWNSFFGQAAGQANTLGVSNAFFGQNAGNANQFGDNNCFFGTAAGYENISGDGNVFIGFKAGYHEKGNNKLYITNSDDATPLVWGDFATNNIIIYGDFKATGTSLASDERLKKDVKPLESSLDKISHLHGVSYKWKADEYPNFGFKKGREIGLIAQDVEKELPELVSKDRDGYKALSYAKLTAVLVEAVKELKAQNEKQQAEINRLRKSIKDPEI